MEFIIEPVFQIRCGLCHTTILQKTTGQVYTCGFDAKRYIGHVKLYPIFFPKQIKEISCESFATIAYATDGTRYTSGDPEYERFFSPDKLKSKFNVCTKYSHNKISRNTNIGLFLCADGKLYFVEKNTHPRLVELGLTPPYKIIQIGYYGKSMFVLVDCGWMYSWGNNGSGQLGVGDRNWHENPTRINLNDIIAFSCGQQYTVALDKNHNVWEWGYNSEICILNPKKIPLDNIIQVCCGTLFTMALDLSGHLYGWGNNRYGELGLGDYNNTSKPRKLELEGVISVACGEEHVVALTLQNEIYVWGNNITGQLGLGDYKHRVSPQKLEF